MCAATGPGGAERLCRIRPLPTRAGGSCVERDSFASWFVMRGGSLHALLGHRDIKLTLRDAHLAPGHRRDEIDKTAATISAPVGTKSAQPGRIDIAPPASV